MQCEGEVEDEFGARDEEEEEDYAGDEGHDGQLSINQSINQLADPIRERIQFNFLP